MRFVRQLEHRSSYIGGICFDLESLQATQREVQAWESAKKFVVPDKIKRVR